MKQLILGYLENNCYLINSKDAKTLYIVDAPSEATKIIECAEHHFKFEEVIILLTHAHADHIGALKELVNHFGVQKIMLDSRELPLYNSPQNCILPWLVAQTNLPLTEEPSDTIDFEVIRTPGHTAGGVCYYFKSQKSLFTGDTLFYRSVGRTDLPGGSSKVLTQSIREKLFELPSDVMVFPGHGPMTTIGDEQKLNPYV